MRASPAKVVSFSGIDGAGKSTQIQALESHLRMSGFCPIVYTFWDDVAVFARLRELLSHKAFKGDKGVGNPENPISRRDKNVTSWAVTAVRLFLYFFDTLSLLLVKAQISRQGADFIIFDRYIYDELANLPLRCWPVRVYVRILLGLSPKPDIAYLVDAEPEAACIRKPEYPLDFLRQNRDAYLTMRNFISVMTVVGPLSVEETTSQILESISPMCLPRDRASFKFQTQYPASWHHQNPDK